VNSFGRNDIVDLRAPCPSTRHHLEGPNDVTQTTRDEFASRVGSVDSGFRPPRGLR
jgi:hypothetical protein